MRERRIGGCGSEALALYLFLVVVGDSAGLSYYSDRAVFELLSLEAEKLCVARAQLIRAGLLAYQKPIYQLLSLDALEPADAAVTRRHSSGPQLLSEVLKHTLLRRTCD